LAEVERRVKGWMNRWREEGGRARESGRGEWKEGVCVYVCEREIERERRARDVQGESLAER
jgi:hypothetical protein